MSGVDRLQVEGKWSVETHIETFAKSKPFGKRIARMGWFWRLKRFTIIKWIRFLG
jgi:hypothetical protein